MRCIACSKSIWDAECAATRERVRPGMMFFSGMSLLYTAVVVPAQIFLWDYSDPCNTFPTLYLDVVVDAFVLVRDGLPVLRFSRLLRAASDCSLDELAAKLDRFAAKPPWDSGCFPSRTPWAGQNTARVADSTRAGLLQSYLSTDIDSALPDRSRLPVRNRHLRFH